MLSAYRSEYEGKRGDLSWPQFVDLLISNGLGPEPGARDSKTLQPPAWYHTAPYWKHCGLCRPELRPKYILHMDKLGQWCQHEHFASLIFSPTTHFQLCTVKCCFPNWEWVR